VENELLELSLKREAAQQLFETEQYNRLLVEELQAEEELNKIILLKAYLERLKAAYVNNIAAKVKSLWRYQGAEDNWTADVYVLQDKDGKVLAVEIQKTNVGDSAKAKVFTDSIERAIYKSSPLPKAPDESIFTEEILFKFGVN
jgi:colicin import membrane protein